MTKYYCLKVDPPFRKTKYKLHRLQRHCSVSVRGQRDNVALRPQEANLPHPRPAGTYATRTRKGRSHEFTAPNQPNKTTNITGRKHLTRTKDQRRPRHQGQHKTTRTRRTTRNQVLTKGRDGIRIYRTQGPVGGVGVSVR